MNTNFLRIICMTSSLLLMGASKMLSQDFTLLSTSGGLASSFNLYLSYSIGEPCISYTLNDDTWMTEGFQQPGHMDIAVSTVQKESVHDLKVFPNPFATTITISGESLNTCYDLRMTNTLGQIVFEKRTASTITQTIDADHLPPGLYVLTIQCQMASSFFQTMIKI